MNKMKSNIALFLLGIFLVILTSATTTVSVMTVKPAIPKYFIVESFTCEENSESVALFIKTKVKQGWVLKSVEGANWSSSHSTWIVVLEKY